MQQLQALATIHVDDLVVAAKKTWLQAAYAKLPAKFGKVKRQELPFTNVGMEYSRLQDGGIQLRQVAYADAQAPAHWRR